MGTPQFYEIGKIVQSFKMYVDVKYICKNIKTIVHWNIVQKNSEYWFMEILPTKLVSDKTLWLLYKAGGGGGKAA